MSAASIHGMSHAATTTTSSADANKRGEDAGQRSGILDRISDVLEPEARAPACVATDEEHVGGTGSA